MNSIFESDEHEYRFYSIMSQDDTSEFDRERISMFYIISGNLELYSHLHEIYSCYTHRLKPNPLNKLGYMCSSSQKLLMLALHLYNSGNGNRHTPFDLLNCLDKQNVELALNAMRLRFT